MSQAIELKKLGLKIVKKIAYPALIPFILIIGLVTLPLTLIFNWNGMWVICIAHDEWCSLKEAKRLFLENKDGKYTEYCGYKENNRSILRTDLSSSFDNQENDIFNNTTGSSSFSHDLHYSPSYSYYPSNIHHSSTSE